MAVAEKSEESKSQKQSEKGPSSPAKRNTNPGIRLIHGRIYDSQNGKTCHQCRQKTRDFSASCKNLKSNKPCPITFCHKCLLNRYGEKAEDVGILPGWSCPKCRGICNCSVCMKKRGHHPTGILIHAAKANGYLSVSEMLQIREPVNSYGDKSVACINVSPRKRSVPEMVERKSKKVKAGGTKKLQNDIANDSVDCIDLARESRKLQAEQEDKCSEKDCSSLRKETSPPGGEKKPKKMKVNCKLDYRTLKTGVLTGSIRNHEEVKVENDKLKEIHIGNKNDNTFVKRTSPRRHQISNGTSNGVAKSNMHLDLQKRKISKAKVENQRIQNSNIDADIALPQGTELSSVHDIPIPPEDVGKALQFLEFCAVFGKVLGVKKEQPDCVLRDLMHGRSSRRGKYSLTVQFLMKLLSVIRKDRGQGSLPLSPTCGKNSWIHALTECISESGSVGKTLDLDPLDKGADGYENLSSSKKLMLLNLLCDEVLGTAEIRNWMEEQVSKIAKKGKEHKESVLAAKDKEKRLKQKIQDEIVKAVIQKNGDLLSISEYDAVISQIKREAAQAHSELLGLQSKNNQSSEAVRTEPIHLGNNCRAYWRLKCLSNKSDIFAQDFGTGDASSSDEKWFAFEEETKEVIAKHINILRGKNAKGSKNSFASTVPKWRKLPVAVGDLMAFC